MKTPEIEKFVIQEKENSLEISHPDHKINSIVEKKFITYNYIKSLHKRIKELEELASQSKPQEIEWNNAVRIMDSKNSKELFCAFMAEELNSDELIESLVELVEKDFQVKALYQTCLKFSAHVNDLAESRLRESIKPVDTKTVDAVDIPELVNEFMDGFEDPFTRGEMYKSETGVQSINIAYYFELAMEYALLHKQDVESKSKSLSE